jgi:DNA-binding MarR family transcriptional regulator
MDSLTDSKCAEIGKACVASNLRKANRLITQTYDAFLKPSGLRSTQFGILMMVRGFGSVTVTKLANWAIMDRTTVTRNLKLLEAKGLVKIEPGEDQRERVVTITDQGLTDLLSALPHWEEAQHHIADIFGRERSSQLVRELSKMVSTLRHR